MRIGIALLAVSSIAATACNDSSGPSSDQPSITLISGFGVTDTVSAQLASPLVVEVRDSSGALVGPGTIVRFTGVANLWAVPEMLVRPLRWPYYSDSIVAETDADGRASVLVQCGTLPGTARIAVSVPARSIVDTARFTVLPGNAAGIAIQPSDTAIYVGRTVMLRAAVVDRYGNVRSAATATYSGTGSGISVTSAGVVTATAIGRYSVTGTVGTTTGSASISVVPQGRLTAVHSVPATPLRIVAVDLDGSNYRSLTSVNVRDMGPEPRWLSGTNNIVYSEFDGTIQKLRTVDPDGRVATFLPNPPSTMTHQAQASPSAGAPIVYFSAYDTRCSALGYCLHRSARDGSNVELLGSFTPNGIGFGQPSASPDGSKVAFNGAGSIRVFDYTTKVLSSWAVTGAYPSWSPDGTSIVFATSDLGPLGIMNPDGTNVRTIPTGNRLYRQSAIGWSPDSKWVIAHRAVLASPGADVTPVLDLVNVATGQVLPLAFTAAYGPASLK